eukprot:jgi/Bigna1/85677/estExt_fgenesh1_pg.C_50199
MQVLWAVCDEVYKIVIKTCIFMGQQLAVQIIVAVGVVAVIGAYSYFQSYMWPSSVKKIRNLGLLFPVTHTLSLIETRSSDLSVIDREDGAVYITALQEYLCAEMMEISCNHVKKQLDTKDGSPTNRPPSHREISVQDVKAALKGDEELKAVFLAKENKQKAGANAPQLSPAMKTAAERVFLKFSKISSPPGVITLSHEARDLILMAIVKTTWEIWNSAITPLKGDLGLTISLQNALRRVLGQVAKGEEANIDLCKPLGQYAVAECTKRYVTWIANKRRVLIPNEKLEMVLWGCGLLEDEKFDE